MRRFRTILLAIVGLSVAVCLADSPAGSDARPEVKDADAQRIIKGMDTADAKAYADYLRVVQKNHQAAFAKLNARKGDLTRLGKLDDAVAIRDFIDYVTKQDADNIAIAAGTKLFIPVEKALGKWVFADGTKYVLLSDGKFTCGGHQAGFWKLSPTALTLYWVTNQKVDHADIYDQIQGDDALTGGGGRNRITKAEQ